VTKLFCDFCKEEKGPLVVGRLIFKKRYYTQSDTESNAYAEYKDICKDCQKKLEDMIF